MKHHESYCAMDVSLNGKIALAADVKGDLLGFKIDAKEKRISFLN